MAHSSHCVTGCTTRTYREEIILLLNCIAEKTCTSESPDYSLSETTTCCGTTVSLLKDGIVLSSFHSHDIGQLFQAAPIIPEPTQVVMPVYWNGFEFSEAHAMVEDTLATFLVTRSNTATPELKILNQGFYCGTGHGLTVGEWYALSPDAAGELVLESALNPETDIIQRILYVVSADCVYLALDLSGTTNNSQGPQGIAGPAGTNGVNGLNGTAGAPGTIGAQGAQGLPGPTGSQGPAGPTGPAGSTSLTSTVEQAAHGYPASTIIPLRYDSTASDYVGAQANTPATAADVLLVGISGVNYFLVQNHGPLYLPDHGYTVGKWYVLNPDVPGGVIAKDALVTGDYLQYLFFVIDSNNLLLSVSPMDGTIP